LRARCALSVVGFALTNVENAGVFDGNVITGAQRWSSPRAVSGARLRWPLLKAA
jgi:hypothetical protein